METGLNNAAALDQWFQELFDEWFGEENPAQRVAKRTQRNGDEDDDGDEDEEIFDEESQPKRPKVNNHIERKLQEILISPIRAQMLVAQMMLARANGCTEMIQLLRQYINDIIYAPIDTEIGSQ